MKEVERNRVGERWKRAWKGYHCLLSWEAGHRIRLIESLRLEKTVKPIEPER